MQDLGNKALLQETGTSQRQPHLSHWAVGYSRLAPPPQAPSHSNLLSKYRLESTRDVVVLVTHWLLPYGDLDVRITLQEEKRHFSEINFPTRLWGSFTALLSKGSGGPPHLGVKQESWNPLKPLGIWVLWHLGSVWWHFQKNATLLWKPRVTDLFKFSWRGWPESSHCLQQREFPKQLCLSLKVCTRDSYEIPPSLPALLHSHSPFGSLPSLHAPAGELPTTSSPREWNEVHALTLSIVPSFFKLQ